ncbi:MAG: GvpL/GvpF family gas vesicle protein, partial [Xanthobacteraceae bacterium]|nr:GvpL/GvpF family gas vesicle protein [Xanthobacteraceae bacterium]
MSAIDPLVYAYGVVRLRDSGSLGSLSAVEGVSGSLLRTVSCGDLAVVISDVPQHADGAIEDVWRDPERIKHMVLDHHRVLRTVANDCTVLPLRFGAVFSSDERVAAMLGAQRERLCAALERIDGAREWGIQLFCDRAALRSRLGAEAPAIRAAREQIAATTAGRAFFLRHKLGQALDAETQDAIDRCVADCRTSL